MAMDPKPNDNDQKSGDGASPGSVSSSLLLFCLIGLGFFFFLIVLFDLFFGLSDVGFGLFFFFCRKIFVGGLHKDTSLGQFLLSWQADLISLIYVFSLPL